MVWLTSAQTGMSDTFQLTLGGMFGNGPAWQNKLTASVSNVFRGGDAVYVYGWNSLDTRGLDNSWQAGAGYKCQVLKTERHTLTLGSGVQRWLFPTVKTGANDWLIPGSLAYQTRLGKVPIAVTQDSWTLLSSPLTKGSLLHTQVWLQHGVYRNKRLAVTFKHGPAHTYSWNFYGTNGNRVLRYQTMLAIAWKNTQIEGGLRKQWGLQNGIQDNRYWQFAITRTLAVRLPR